MNKKTTITLRQSDKQRFEKIAEQISGGYDVPCRVTLNKLMDCYEENNGEGEYDEHSNHRGFSGGSGRS